MCYSLLFLLFTLITLGTSAVPVAAGEDVEAIDRGRLSLAWDAHDSGLFREALEYLAEIPATSTLTPRAAWLRAECLYDLGEYAAAAAVLLSPEGSGVDGRDELLSSIFRDQMWEATARGDYGEALQALDAARQALPADPELRALQAATEFRLRVIMDLSADGATTGQAAVVPEPGRPPGEEWVRVYPWQEEEGWVPQASAEEWCPECVRRARAANGSLWVRVPDSVLAEELEREARRVGLTLQSETWGWSVGKGSERAELWRMEWRFRAATEGLGPRGAARFAVIQATEVLSDQEAILSWVDAHRGVLEQSRTERGVELRHPSTGRTFVLDPLQWAGSFREAPDVWREFWRDLSLELGRAPAPYRCFCGRPVNLREALVADSDELVVVDREGRFAVVVVALCPLHLRYVDRALLTEWKVTVATIAARARADARRSPWHLEFGRGEVEGGRYLFLEGEGVASLARSPGLLLGALELADGYGVRGTAVRVHAITDSTLVVTGNDVPESVTHGAVSRLLLEQARQGTARERLDYRATLQLPAESQGTFRLTPAE